MKLVIEVANEMKFVIEIPNEIQYVMRVAIEMRSVLQKEIENEICDVSGSTNQNVIEIATELEGANAMKSVIEVPAE